MRQPCGGYAQVHEPKEPIPALEKPRWTLHKALCWLLGHSWAIQPNHTFRCACGASCAVRPGTELNQ